MGTATHQPERSGLPPRTGERETSRDSHPTLSMYRYQDTLLLSLPVDGSWISLTITPRFEVEFDLCAEPWRGMPRGISRLMLSVHEDGAQDAPADVLKTLTTEIEGLTYDDSAHHLARDITRAFKRGSSLKLEDKFAELSVDYLPPQLKVLAEEFSETAMIQFRLSPDQDDFGGWSHSRLTPFCVSASGQRTDLVLFLKDAPFHRWTDDSCPDSCRHIIRVRPVLTKPPGSLSTRWSLGLEASVQRDSGTPEVNVNDMSKGPLRDELERFKASPDVQAVLSSVNASALQVDLRGATAQISALQDLDALIRVFPGISSYPPHREPGSDQGREACSSVDE